MRTKKNKGFVMGEESIKEAYRIYQDLSRVKYGVYRKLNFAKKLCEYTSDSVNHKKLLSLGEGSKKLNMSLFDLNYTCDTYDHPNTEVKVYTSKNNFEILRLKQLVKEIIDIETEIDYVVQQHRDSLEEFIGSAESISVV